MNSLKCPRCSGSMMRGLTRGTFTGWRGDGMAGRTETIKFMCTGCGYVEERAINSLDLKKVK